MLRHSINLDEVSISELKRVIFEETEVFLSDEVLNKVKLGRSFIEAKIQATDSIHYGINTGFGSLCNIAIPNSDLEKLQRNLIFSHACGMGELVPVDVIKIILYLKIRNLSLGHSGVRIELIEFLVKLYNANVWPVLYQLGSLGASGDLAPLAHLSLPIIGEGEVWFHGKICPSKEVLDNLGIKSLILQSKEGLALLNGTQFSTAYGLWSVWQAEAINMAAHNTTAVSFDAFDASIKPLDAKLHNIRKHNGQIKSAELLRSLLSGSEIANSPKLAVQDPYSFRCSPQVLGASWGVIDYVSGIIENEINAITDNPTIFPEEDEILSGGNFHAQPIALALDYLAIALSEIASISERRMFQLISGLRGLPSFLTPASGLNSGFMIPQYTAASIVSQNKQLCSPASVDSIVSSNGQEDHVSMAANAGTKLYRVVENTWMVIGIEWLIACQALDFRRPKLSSPQLESLHKKFRTQVPFLAVDTMMHDLMKISVSFIKSNLPK